MKSVNLRMPVEQPFVVSLADFNDVNRIDTLFGWFKLELNDSETPSPTSLAAYMRLVLIQALHIHRPEPSESGAEETSILREFRHPVEQHYCEHWLVARYAKELGIDYDRLHRICKRETGRAPQNSSMKSSPPKHRYD